MGLRRSLFSVTSILLITVFHKLALRVNATELKCYDVRGAELDSTYVPCNTGAKHSGCCATNRPGGSPDLCLNSGLCLTTSGELVGTVIHSGCTDPTGKDEACAKVCARAPTNNTPQPFQGWNIQACDVGAFCCRAIGDTNSCCNNDTALHFSATSLGAVMLPAYPSSSGTSSPSVDPSSVLATAVSTGSPSPSTNSSIGGSTLSPNTAILAGAIAGPLSATVLVLIGLVIWMAKREKRQRRLKEHYEEQFGQNFAYRRTVVVERNIIDDEEKKEKDNDDVYGRDPKEEYVSGSRFDTRGLGMKISQEPLVGPR